MDTSIQLYALGRTPSAYPDPLTAQLSYLKPCVVGRVAIAVEVIKASTSFMVAQARLTQHDKVGRVGRVCRCVVCVVCMCAGV